ncbi:TetR/AcrR family transcriptional regulator [Kineosporia succinea]|uniref:AcrR family transcriptional regulator n=1 Tax=Kineosporia succinea TaxID=84632 RepID=A0ABT9NX43_9ACTN|nr:TetR/AcrR family transcriptional regulator [Kineosporia succinea]MDP9824993.1 AcrR family transcriptional regulator [Kineosporia succinea]
MSEGKRGGDKTRREAQRVAFELFTSQGYEATSLREIAERLGINKASLYYHFRSKEAILVSLFTERAQEAEDLVTWVREQPPGADLLERAVMRWVDSFSTDKLRGIRFMAANPHIGRSLSAAEGDRIGSGLNELAELLSGLLPRPTPVDVMLVRMAVTSINAAVHAAAGSELNDDDIVEAARTSARTLLREVSSRQSGTTTSPARRGSRA